MSPPRERCPLVSRAATSYLTSLTKDPEHIMPTYLFLMGDDSLGITGKSFDAQ